MPSRTAMPPRTGRPAHPRHLVTAVLVSHDGERWLPRTLSAIQSQHRAPQRLVAVDTGSTDASVELLTGYLGASHVLTAPRTTGFGAAVQLGLDAFAGAPLPPDGPRAGDGQPVEWVWLLHDDAAPAPDALLRLLDFAEDRPSAVVIGPKLRDWDHPRVLLQVGLTTDGGGHRHTGLDRREVDQGQHDGVADVLAVGSAGALIRRDVWDALGGFDPELALFRDDLDFGWRANLAGHRVAVAPDAVVHHAQAGARGQRPLHATSDHPRRIDRRHALYTVVVNSSWLGAVVGPVRLAVGTLLRALLLLLTRRPGRAVDELAAYAYLLLHPATVLRARAVRRRQIRRRLPRRDLRALMARPHARLRLFLDRLGDRVGGSGHDRAAVATTTALETGPVSADAEVLAGPRLRWWRIFTRPGFLLFLALSTLTVVAEHRLVAGHGILLGGRLLPPLGGASDLWHTYLSSWHDVGLGSTTAAPPAVAALGVVATVLLGKVWLAVDVLLLGAVPLAGLTAYAAVGRLRVGRELRVWAAATYALLPVAAGVVAGGRLGDAVGFVLVPLVLASGGSAIAAAACGGGWRHAWACGLWLAAAAAFAPPLWPVIVAVLAGVVLASLTGALGGWRGALRTVGTAVVAAGVPVGTLLPWSIHLWSAPAPLVLGVGAGATPEPPGVPAPTALQLLLGHPGGPALPPLWLLAPLVAAALVATLRRDRSRTSVIAWLTVSAAVAIGVVQGRTLVHPPTGGPAQLGWPGMAVAVAGGGLIAGALLAASGARRSLARRSFGWRQPLAGVVVVAAAAVPLAAAGTWIARGTPGPIGRVAAGTVLPAFVAEDLASSPGVRALVLREEPDGTVGYALAGGQPVSVTTAALRPLPGTQARVAAVAHALTGGPGPGAAHLATLGVRYVVAGHDPDGRIESALDAQPGLARSAAEGPVAVWRTVAPAGGMEVLPATTAGAAAGGSAPDVDALAGVQVLPLRGDRTTATVPSGAFGRLLVLATPSDARWTATLDGKPLPSRSAWGWAQAFALPATGGHLLVEHRDRDRTHGLWLALGCLALALVLAAPTVRDDEPDAEPDGGSRTAPPGDTAVAGGDVPSGFVSPRVPDSAPVDRSDAAVGRPA